jgi:hypothetical protein
MASAPLPREIIKWLQSLDLTFVVKNPKRDLSNGYLIAEILSRSFPKDINLMSFENGTRLEAKVDNWEQLYKFFKKKQIAVAKQDFDPVIHCAPNAAQFFICKLYQLLTKKQLKYIAAENDEAPAPAFMRETASYRLKDHEIARVVDKNERTYVAIGKLGQYHEERRILKQQEAPLLLQEERRRKKVQPGVDLEMQSREIHEDSVQVDEVRVKSLQVDSTQLRPGPGGRSGPQQGGVSLGSQSSLVKKVSTPRGSAVGALAGMQPPALFVKPAMDIMRPLVQSIIQESEELSKLIDARKDIVVSFMEQCREHVPEETSVRVFETLANRAQLLVESLTRSSPEFWKVWSTFYPALTDFSEQSMVFESAVYFFKRIGDLMREADPTLTQQLVTEVGLPSLAKELARSPEKREHLCEIIYSYTQEDTLNHLLVLRALKEKLNDTPVYISCLSCLISRDAQLSLLDDYLLDLYIYYALVAIQSPQPKIRVAGTAILCTIVMCSSQDNSVVALIPSFAALANDDWWEVQAQLLLLSAHLLSKITASERNEERGEGDSGTDKVETPAGVASGYELGGQGDEMAMLPGSEDAVAQLQEIIGRLFVVSNSKNVLQVGLSALCQLLFDFTDLQPLFVAVLLEQPAPLRQRLLRPVDADGAQDVDSAAAGTKLVYVSGSSTRQYEEKCISLIWPHLDMAKTFVKQQQRRSSPLGAWEEPHLEVFFATLPPFFEEDEAEEWLQQFEQSKQYIFVALVDPYLHSLSTRIISKFWRANVEQIANQSVEASSQILLQALRLLYREKDRATVEESKMINFLKDMRDRGGTVEFEITNVVQAFQDAQPDEYQASQLWTLLVPTSG